MRRLLTWLLTAKCEQCGQRDYKRDMKQVGYPRSVSDSRIAPVWIHGRCRGGTLWDRRRWETKVKFSTLGGVIARELGAAIKEDLERILDDPLYAPMRNKLEQKGADGRQPQP